MSHTEQMREALDRMDALLDSGTGLLAVPAGSATHAAAVADMRTIRAALTAPAAEVPEAMGDEPALPSPWKAKELASNQGVFTASQLRAYAKQYAQWQSARLRAAAVPDGREVVRDAEILRYVMDWNTKDFAICKRVGATGQCWEPIKTTGPIEAAMSAQAGNGGAA